MHFRFKPRRNPGSQSQHRSVNRTAVRFRRALDIGCGTGLVGAAVHDIVDELEGVDISAKMIDQSRRKALYNALYVDDAAAFLGRSAEHGSDYDLIVAADVFIYVGRIDAIFAAARRRLAEGGLFVFSVETLDRGDYALRQSGRYAQSDNYIPPACARVRPCD